MRLKEIEKILDCVMGMTFPEIRGESWDKLKLTTMIKIQVSKEGDYTQTTWFDIPDSGYALIEEYNEHRDENGEWFYNNMCVLVPKKRAFKYMAKVCSSIQPGTKYNASMVWDNN